VKAASIPPGLITLSAKPTGRAVCGKTARTVPRGRGWKRTGRSGPAPRQSLTRQRHWRSCKDLARLDHLNTGRPTILWVFIAVSLLLQTLADQITAELRANRVRSAVSGEIVLATVIEWWNDIAGWLRRSDGFEQIRWIAFRNVLIYDSRHRYSTRPRRIEQVLDEITRRAQERTMAARTLAQS
jgi:hypothetical protein